jgi:tetratricopeptide (TPR) repeat protein
MAIVQDKIKSARTDVFSICKKAQELIDAGEYKSAADELSDLWKGVGKRPDITRLPTLGKAEILLLAGSLTSLLGSAGQVENSQEKAKDLLCEAAEIFETEEILDKWAEARSELAVCYWREGAFDEARIILQDALEKVSAENYPLRGQMIVRQVNVEISTHQYKFARLLLEKAAAIIEPHGTDLLRGKLYFHRALVQRKLAEEENKPEYLNEAVGNYKKASDFYEKAGHHLYRAIVENNLGFLLCSLGKYKESQTRLDRALDFYMRADDKIHAASTLENKALASLGAGDLAGAERYARLSVELIHEGDEKSKLAESLTTLGKVLARRNNFDEAKKYFQEAARCAATVGDYESAGAALLTLIEELRGQFSDTEAQNIYLRAAEITPKTARKTTLERLEKISAEFLPAGQKSFVENKAEKWKGFSLPDEVKKFEAKFVFEALQDANGRVTKAAEFLGISHQTLSLLLKQRHSNLAFVKKPRKPRTVKRLQPK